MSEVTILKPLDEYAICPSCGVSLEWSNWRRFVGQYNMDNYTYINSLSFQKTNYPLLDFVVFVICKQCKIQHIFYGEKLIYPRVSTHTKPHILLDNYPKSKILFNESLAVANDSPRAGLTLSRMCLESLVNDIFSQRGESINPTQFNVNIKKLVELDIINSRIERMLDNTRVIGNKSTHNFNLIESEDINIEDCELVWKAINHIMDSIKHAQDLDEDLNLLVTKVKS